MAWCKASSLTAAVARTLSDLPYPMSRSRILRLTQGRVVEGWDLSHFLGKALAKSRYEGVREVLTDLESWLEVQG